MKVELDRLFGADRFVNEIVWCYSVGGKSPRAMTGPMFALAGACVVIGVAPLLVAPVLDAAVSVFGPAPPLASLVPLPWISGAAAALLALLGAAALLLRGRLTTAPTGAGRCAGGDDGLKYGTGSSRAANSARSSLRTYLIPIRRCALYS